MTVEYDAQGEHRAGTLVDEANARWLVRELAGAGLSARLERFDFERFVQRRADVICGGDRRHGMAACDGGTTGPEGVSGRLGRVGSKAEIDVAFVAPNPKPAALEELERARSAGKHRPIVVLPELGAAHGDLALINTERFATPDATPLVQLAGTRAWPLQQGIRAGGEAREIATRQYLSVLGTNPLFHSPDDRWPYAVDLPKTVALSEVRVAIAKQLAS